MSLMNNCSIIRGDWSHGTQYLLIKIVSCHLEKGGPYNNCEDQCKAKCKIKINNFIYFFNSQWMQDTLHCVTACDVHMNIIRE